MSPGDAFAGQPSGSQAEDDLYIKYKTLERNMEFLEIQARPLPCSLGRSMGIPGKPVGSSARHTNCWKQQRNVPFTCDRNCRWMRQATLALRFASLNCPICTTNSTCPALIACAPAAGHLAADTSNVSNDVQEEYIKEEQRNLKRELLRAQEEVKRIQSVPLVLGQFLEMVDANSGVVTITTGMQYTMYYATHCGKHAALPSSLDIVQIAKVLM